MQTNRKAGEVVQSGCSCSTFLHAQKERDLELAARIGQSLLKQNQELTARNERLDEQLEMAKEEVNMGGCSDPDEAAGVGPVESAELTLRDLPGVLQIAQLRHELSMRDDLLQFYASTEELENAESLSL